ncbi:outer-membrane lipoprotein carrier protein LolA [Microvirga zambiensis]|uniref:outer-membrane lipoprotein carrier protein LolA n=1 Tax=Microvirga zambiensis TaxID=1402137 RepID=UPI001FEA553F|nr:outer-membrane lipoprotein carrier protein LolA [Microvirga zambiensis]
MRPLSLASLATALSFGAGALPAMGQTLPIELIMPPSRSVAAQRFSRSASSLPTAFFHRGPMPASPPRPVIPRPANAEQVLAVTTPLPPSRPPAAEMQEDFDNEPMAIAPFATAAVELAPPARPLSNSAVVEKANAYFTHLNTLVADFSQVGGDGRRVKGTLFLQRPGKVRFEYDPPSNLQVIADGRSVAVRDRKLATQDLYSISQTPLKFLLRERVNLGQDIRITGITNDGDSVRIHLQDSSTLGGTSRITLYFDPQVEILSQWRIVDAQGFQTMVMLDKIERGRRIDQDMFKIQYEAILGGNN